MTVPQESTSTSSGDVSLGTTTATQSQTQTQTQSPIPDDAIEAAQSASPAVLVGERDEAGLRQACQAAAVCDEFRAEDIVVLDLTTITPLFDYFVVATGTSRRQMHAIAEEVDKALKSGGSRRKGIEGYHESSWIVEDYGDIVLHVFTEESRENYDLEGLWADAPRVNWQAVLESQPA